MQEEEKLRKFSKSIVCITIGAKLSNITTPFNKLNFKIIDFLVNYRTLTNLSIFWPKKAKITFTKGKNTSRSLFFVN